MDFWRYNSMWFEEVPEDQYVHLNLKEDKIEEIKSQYLEYLVLWHHKKSKSGNFNDIPDSLRYLELNWSTIQNFAGVEKLSNLKRLDLHYCTKLQDDSGISKIKNTLEILEINNSRKLVPNDLLELNNLRVLRLNACGNLENLSFLCHFPKLISFAFVDTNVLDGDLTPLIDHPTIREAGFMNKRHYNYKYETLENLLEEKNGGKPYRDMIRKGKYETFRYIDG
ncbi:hypothetical protein [Peribacillus sp. SCS-37]|uniref:hypothetical protein n=1 Tax=Paraperibacillus esterisolvens TaxID=3115296 RepID=UPI0039059BFC